MSEEKRKINWDTSVMELPEDVSFEGCRDRLNRPDKYETDKLFAYDCYKISEHAVIDERLAEDVLEMYDILLEKGVSKEVESNICQGLGMMVQYNPKLRDSVVELGVKHHPLFEKDLMNYNHLYTEEIESMQGDVMERLKSKNKDILGNLKDKVSANKSDNSLNCSENVKETYENKLDSKVREAYLRETAIKR